MDRAFYAPDGDDPEHALPRNLAPVTDKGWLLAAPGGGRTIVQIAWHVAEYKFMYANQAFDGGTMDWHDFDSRHKPELPGRDAMINFLSEGQAYLRGFVDKLDDGELIVERKWHPGPMMETRWLISAMIEHDLYHSGEINHIRALLQGNDVWPDY
jgi:uncharacterized damage-inducible protein DinB